VTHFLCVQQSVHPTAPCLVTLSLKRATPQGGAGKGNWGAPGDDDAGAPLG
jgi:hypothetical protein